MFSWEMAEELAVVHMREIGFLDARRTPGGADRGIDVIATGAAAQVKHMSSPVGGPDIQRVRGAAFTTSQVLFYSSSGYTAAALRAAEITDVALFAFTVANHVTEMNDLARRTRGHTLATQALATIYGAWRALSLRQRSWVWAVRRRDDGTLRRGSGSAVEPQRLRAVQLARNVPANQAAEVVEQARLALMDIGMKLGTIRRGIRDKSPEELRELLTDAEGHLVAFQQQLLDRLGDSPELRRLVNEETRNWIIEDPEDYGGLPGDICFARTGPTAATGSVG
ncbi:restriction endonuclease [Agromyces albus]|uniref:Restriction endonuclease n=1 Tax=Agromyces albus TaxID=205332 RepID=A0A4Q2L5X5_9MICO|nr:restriction endonuclease [Agromyces albus]RXZ71873.1 restriction endonuclease [Agromyces albus]